MCGRLQGASPQLAGQTGPVPLCRSPSEILWQNLEMPASMTYVRTTAVNVALGLLLLASFIAISAWRALSPSLISSVHRHAPTRPPLCPTQSSRT